MQVSLMGRYQHHQQQCMPTVWKGLCIVLLTTEMPLHPIPVLTRY